MTLGIIGSPKEESFNMTKDNVLDMNNWSSFMALLYVKSMKVDLVLSRILRFGQVS